MDQICADEIKRLLNLKKMYDGKPLRFPKQGEKLQIELGSEDKREKFIIDMNRARIDISKATFQNRARKVIVLVRLDLGSQPHRNPDGTEILSPHIHIYDEQYGDKIARALPKQFVRCKSMDDFFDEFLNFCNVVKKPIFQRGLFDERN